MRDYLDKRKITRKTAVTFGMGAAPDSWDALLTAMTKKGYAKSELLATGLAVQGKGGKLYGKVTNEAIAQALKNQYGMEIDKRKFEPEEPIKSAGQVLCTVRLSAGVSTRMVINVTVEEK